MTRMERAHQLFINRDRNERISLIVAKTTDDFLIAGERESIGFFFGQLKQRFTVGKEIIEQKMKFNG